MPAVAAAAASLAAGASFAAVVGQLVLGLVSSVLLNAASSVLFGREKPATDAGGFSQAAIQRTQVIRSPVSPRRTIYGEIMVSGTLAFAAVTGNRQYLHLVIMLAGHELEAIDEIYLSDLPLGPLDGSGFNTRGRYVTDGGSLVRVKKHLGSEDQLADPDLVSEVAEWTNDHRLRGIAYIYVRLQWWGGLYNSGIPNIRARVRGKKLYDPRDAGVAIDSSGVAGDVVTINTSAAHGLTTGQRGYIRDHDGAKIAGEYPVTVVTPTSFTVTQAGASGGNGGTVTLMAYSTNPALCVRDFMRFHPEVRAPDDAINDSVVIASANTCDETVALTAASDDFIAKDVSENRFELQDAANHTDFKTGDKVTISTTGTLPAGLSAGTYWFIRIDVITGTQQNATNEPGFRLASSYVNALLGVGVAITDTGTGTHSISLVDHIRYDCNGAFDAAQDPLVTAEDIMTAIAGPLVFAQGQLRPHAAQADTATVTITESDLRGPVTVRPRVERRRLFNRVTGTIVDPDNFFEPTDFPPVTNATYEAQDGGQVLSRDIELPFTTNSIRAQRIAKIHLEKSRQGITVELPLKWTMLQLSAWDTVNITLSDFGWSGKKFRLLSWALAENGEGIDVVAQEEADAAYSWSAGDETTVDLAPDTSLPDPFDVDQPANLTLASGTAELLLGSDGTVISRVRATWDAITDEFVLQGGRLEIQAKKVSASVWDAASIIAPDQTQAFISPVEDGVAYNVRARLVNAMGVPSDWTNADPHNVVGKTAAPGDVDTFNITRLPDGTRRFVWTHASVPADVRAGGGYLIRAKLGTGHAWGALDALHTGVLLASPFETNELAAGEYTFAIKAIDSSGNESTNAVIIEATIGDPRLRDVLVNQDEFDLGWPGTKVSGFVNVEGHLEATSSQTWDDLPATWDDLADTWRGLLTNNSPVEYTTQVIDLGADLSFTPLVTVEGSGTQTLTMRTGTEADGAPVGSFVALAHVTGKRYIEVKASLAGTTPFMQSMVTLIDAGVTIDDYEDIDTSAASGGLFERIATGHFKLATRGEIAAISQVSVNAFQSAGSGWTWELLSKATTITGNSDPAAEFKIYKDGTLTDATVDVTIKGPTA